MKVLPKYYDLTLTQENNHGIGLPYVACNVKKIRPFISNGVYLYLSYFSLQQTCAKPCEALDILIALNALQ